MGWVRACPAEGLPRCTSLILTRAYHHCSSKKCVRVQRPLPCGSLRPELWEGDSPTARAPGRGCRPRVPPLWVLPPRPGVR